MPECNPSENESRDLDSRKYQRTQMQKEMIIEKLKENGGRITKQRLMLLDIILEDDCSSCKEIFYKASKKDHKIGTATVYRMINALEEIGAISRKNMYKVAYADDCTMEDACTVVLDDSTTYHLSAQEWNKVVAEGLKSCGYADDDHKIVSVSVRQCDASCNKNKAGEDK